MHCFLHRQWQLQKSRVIHLDKPRTTNLVLPYPSFEVYVPSFLNSHLVVSLAVFTDDPNPLQHVLSVLRLQQVFTEVLCVQPKRVFVLRFAVSNVHKAAPDADWLFLFGPTSQHHPFEHCLSLVFVEEQRVGPKHGKHPPPRPDGTTHLLQEREKRQISSIRS